MKKDFSFANCGNPWILQFRLYHNVVATLRILRFWIIATTLFEHIVVQWCEFSSSNIAATFHSQCCKIPLNLHFVFAVTKALQAGMGSAMSPDLNTSSKDLECQNFETICKNQKNCTGFKLIQTTPRKC